MTSTQQKNCGRSTPHQAVHLSRRALLAKALQIGTLGCGATGITSWLSACNDITSSRNMVSTTIQSTSKAPVEITWQSEQDNTLNALYSILVATYNNTNKDQINVKFINGTGIYNQQYQGVTSHFASKKPTGSPEVISMDVTWTDEFATKGWVIPLDDRWDTKERQNYLSLPLQAATFNKRLYAAPFRTDIGLLYYRSDLIQAAPQTWDELTQQAQEFQHNRQIPYGYVWQGNLYEGLLCNFIEVLHSYGATLLDEHGEVVIYSDQYRDKAVKALSKMVSWVGDISPQSSQVNILRFEENDAFDIWQKGNALFMRNWPYAIPLSNAADQSKVAGKFNIAPLPHGSCCIGGWQLGINAFASPEKQDAAWKFIYWMLQEDAQVALAQGASLAVTLKSVYDNSYVQQYNPFYPQLKQIFEQSGILRPRSVNYQNFSSTIQNYVYMALNKQLSPSDALESLQIELPPILKSSSRPKP